VGIELTFSVLSWWFTTFCLAGDTNERDNKKAVNSDEHNGFFPQFSVDT